MSEGMRKKNIGVLSAVVAGAIILLLTVVYLIMDRGKMLQAYKSSALLLDQVKSTIELNNSKQQSLTDSLKENYIAKAKAVSYIIDRVPEVEFDVSEMIRISKLMAIDEIHIFDESGKIYSGTVPAYYGYSFDSGEQMSYFKPMLVNKYLTMCQDVTPNTAEEKPMMYAICWNDSGRCMIQIGIEPRRLIEEMRSSEISEIIMGIPTYDGVDIFVSDRKSGEVLGSTVNRYLGRNISGMGLSTEGLTDGMIKSLKNDLEGRQYYCSMCTDGDYVITVVRERAEINRELPLSLLVVLVYLLITAAAIGFIVRYMTRRIIEEHTNANIDVMTGFLNRRAYENDMKISGQDELPDDFAYFSIDLNGLKEINDIYGHEAGDELIVGAAQCMAQTFGNLGKLYRIGGDEFTAIVHLGKKKPEELVNEYEQNTKDWSERHNRRLSTACGYASKERHPEKNAVELARIADAHMYEVKAEFYNSIGRDRRKGIDIRKEGEEENG